MQFLFRLCNPKLRRSFSTDIQKVSPIQTLLKRGFTPTLESINCFLFFLLYCRRFKLVIHFFSVLNFKKIVCNNETRSIIAWALLKSHKYEEAEYLMKIQMIKFSTNRMWNSLVNGLNEKDPEKTLSVLRYCLKILEDSGICMDDIMCNILIKAFFMVGADEDARQLFMGMSKLSLVANSVTYSAMIDGYSKIGRIDKAVDVFDEFMSSSSFSATCYNNIINRLCKNGMIDLACEIFIKLNEKAPQWNLTTHTKLIKGVFEEKGAAEVFQLINRMENFNEDIYNIICNDILSFLCKKGFPMEASEVYQIMRRKGLVIRKDSYYSIIRALIRDGKMGLCQTILNKF